MKPGKASTVLVASDDTEMRESLARHLTKRFRTETTPVDDALSRVRDQPCEVLILDGQPDTHTYEALCRYTSVVLLTSYGTDIHSLSDLIAVGAKFYFPREEGEHIDSYIRYAVLRLGNRKSFIRYMRGNQRLDTRIHRLLARCLFLFSWGTALWAYARLVTRLKVVGLQHVLRALKSRRSVLLIGNHERELEVWVTVLPWLHPRLFLSRRFTPRFLASAATYNRSFLGRLFSYLSNMYLIYPRLGLCQFGLLKFIDSMKTKQGISVVFPEGTPSEQSAAAKSNQPGLGYIAYHSDAVVIPMYSRGQTDVFPRNFSFPRPFKRVSVAFGEPVDIERFRAKSAQLNTFVEISDHIYGELTNLNGGLAQQSQVS